TGPSPAHLPTARTFPGYDQLPDGVRVRGRAAFAAGAVDVAETLRVHTDSGRRRLLREYEFTGVPPGHSAEPRHRADDLPAPQPPTALERVARADSGMIDGSLERPGYRAVAYPRPKAPSGEDLIMPGALAVNPRDGRVF